MNEWFCYASGKQYGSITLEELSLWIRQGRVKDKDLVWKDGMAEWLAASSVPELAALFSTLPPPVPAMPPTPYVAGTVGGTPTGMAPHRGTTILVFGILGFFCCIIFAIVAWVMANEDLRLMDAGRMDPTGRDTTKAGKIIGQIAIALNIIGVVFYTFAAFAGGGHYMH